MRNSDILALLFMIIFAMLFMIGMFNFRAGDTEENFVLPDTTGYRALERAVDSLDSVDNAVILPLCSDSVR